MNVLHVISSGGMYGAEAVILQLSAELSASAGDRVSLGVFHHAGKPKPELYGAASEAGIRSSLIECEGQLDLAAVRSMRDLAACVRADVVHAHGYKADLYAFAALRGARRPALVSTCHTWYDNDLFVRLYGAADRWALGHFDQVVAVSAEVRERLLQAGVREDRIHSIRNGVSVPPLWAEGEPRLARTPGQKLRVGLVGRLAPEKGVDVYLRAAALLAERFPGVRFVVAGEGPERPMLEALLSASGLGDRAVLLGSQSDMGAFYRSLDLLVSASRQEGLPMALLEGMAQGLPVVATYVGEVPTVVADDVTGLVVAPDSPESLAVAIGQMLDNAELRAKFGAAGRARVVRDFSAARMATEYREVYQRAVMRRGACRVALGSSAA